MMEQGRDALKWSPLLPKKKLRQLYLTEAKGLYNDDLINDVGMYLYMRCRDILTVKLAKEDKKVRCPVCDNDQRETFIQRTGGREEIIACKVCGWKIVWEDYIRAVKHKQLNAGGAVKAFEEFIRNFENADSAKEKLLSIDRLIHEFHYSAKERPEQPTRPVGANLIVGNLRSVIEFLDKLSAGAFSVPEMDRIRDHWSRNLHAFETIDWENIVDERRRKRDSKS
jgi:hypothetical protein